MSTIDWSRKVRELRSCGLTLSEIAGAAGATIGTVHDIGTGRTRRVLWETGDAILRLHRRKTVQAALRLDVRGVIRTIDRGAR